MYLSKTDFGEIGRSQFREKTTFGGSESAKQRGASNTDYFTEIGARRIHVRLHPGLKHAFRNDFMMGWHSTFPAATMIVRGASVQGKICDLFTTTIVD